MTADDRDTPLDRPVGRFAHSRRQFMTRAAAVLGAVPFLALGRGAAHAQQAAPARGQRFEFGVMGDMPYTHKQEEEYARLLADLNARELACVVHIGDMLNDPRPYERNPDSSRLPGSDDYYQYVLGTFQSCRHPVVMTPGDNDWADFHEFKKLAKFDPLERLEKVRAMFYPDGRSLGQRTMAVESQRGDPQHGAYRENQRWSVGGVTFATMHVIGSNDNVGRTPEFDAEQKRRMAANLAWLKAAFAKARADNSLGLVLIIHANPYFENYWPASYLDRYFRGFAAAGIKAPKERKPAPHDEFVATLRAEMESYDKPTALFHGDTHLFRHDKPLFSDKTKRPFENFTRTETFGWPDSHWIRVTVDPANPQLFDFTAQMVPENRLHHRA